MYDLKKKEAHLHLANQLIDQIDVRVDFLTRQKATLKMCMQDTTHIDQLLIPVSDAFIKARVLRKTLQAELAALTLQTKPQDSC
jgi:hypothetical protein